MRDPASTDNLSLASTRRQIVPSSLLDPRSGEFHSPAEPALARHQNQASADNPADNLSLNPADNLSLSRGLGRPCYH